MRNAPRHWLPTHAATITTLKNVDPHLATALIRRRVIDTVYPPP